MSESDALIPAGEPRVKSAPYLLLLILSASLAARWRLIDIPLDRDEGEHAYVAYQMPRGLVPYRDAVDSKPPAVFLAYRLFFAAFGESAAGLHLGLAAYHLLAVTAVFLVGRRLVRDEVGLLAAATFAALTSNPAIAAHAARPEMLYLLPAAGAAYALARGVETRRTAWWLGAGLLHGLAWLFKQIAAIQLACLLVWVALRLFRASGTRATLRALAIVVCAAAAPLLAALLWTAMLGAARELIYWTVTYNLEFAASPAGLGDALRLLRRSLAILGPTDAVAWAAALAGVWRAGARRGFLLAWLASALLSVAPGGFFLPYYFLALAPALSVLAGLGFDEARLALARARLPRAAAGLLAAAAASSPLLAQGSGLWLKTRELALRTYAHEPILEAETLGRYLREHTREDDTLLVIGSEPEILFYARRRSASKYSLFYPLTSWSPRAPAMLEEFAREVKQRQPRYVVWMNLPSALWIARPTGRVLPLKDWIAARYRLEATLLVRAERPYLLVTTPPDAGSGGAPALAYVLRRTD